MSPLAVVAPTLEILAVIALIGAARITRCAWKAALALAIAALIAALAVLLLGRWHTAPLAAVALAYLPVLGWIRAHPEAPSRRHLRITLLCLTALAAVPIWLFPVPRLPEPDGPYAVGTITTDWVHRFPEGDRRLKVKFWYPATDARGTPVARYLEPQEAEATIAGIASFAELPAWSFSHVALTRTNGHVAATPAAGGPFPLVLFSHGYWFYAAQNTALAELLASHGYVVASVAHPGDSMPVRYSDGTIVDTIAYEEEKESPGERRFFDSTTDAERLAAYPRFQAEIRDYRILRSLHRWRSDVVGVLDDLQSGSAAGSAAPLTARIDFSRVAFVGMSFGGSVSASTCAIEPRCLAAVNMDGFEYDAAMFDREIGRPLLMLLSDRETYREWNRPINRDHALNDYFYERLVSNEPTGHVYRVRVDRLKHLGFTDLPLALRRPLRTRFTGALERQRAVATVNSTVLRFLDRHVRGDAGAFSQHVIHETGGLHLHRRAPIAIRAGGS